MAAHFEPVVNANCRLVAPPPTRRTAIGGYPKVASYDMPATLLMEAPATAITQETLVPWLWHLCQGQETCTQSKTLVHINFPAVTKKW